MKRNTNQATRSPEPIHHSMLETNSLNARPQDSLVLGLAYEGAAVHTNAPTMIEHAVASFVRGTL